MISTIPATPDFPFPQLPVQDPNKPLELAGFFEGRGVRYVFGGKDHAILEGEQDDLDSITGLDCSGFEGVVWFHMFGVDLEGQNSQGYTQTAGEYKLKESTPLDAVNANGALYLFVLPSADSSDGIGHVGNVRNSATAESYGGHGPGSRPWGPVLSNGERNPAWSWQQHCRIWVMSLGQPVPGSAAPGVG